MNPPLEAIEKRGSTFECGGFIAAVLEDSEVIQVDFPHRWACPDEVEFTPEQAEALCAVLSAARQWLQARGHLPLETSKEWAISEAAKRVGPGGVIRLGDDGWPL
jgi:hypothetical protein